jgi:hypothetical protein
MWLWKVVRAALDLVALVAAYKQHEGLAVTAKTLAS